MNTHEEEFIRSFLQKNYRARCTAKKGIPRGDLWHVVEQKLDPRKVVELPSNVHLPEHIVPVLKQLTDARTCNCISGHRHLENNVIDLDDLDLSDGTVFSIVAGKLAYFRGEHCNPTFDCFLIANADNRKKALSLLHKASAEARQKDKR